MGKSTLMKSLIGVMPARSGQIVVDGTDVTALATHQRVARGLAYVPQGRQIFGTMTVKENIETGLVVTGKTRDSAGDLRSVSDPGGVRAAARRQSLRRPAAAARDRARARERSEDPAARRADRRHPAVDHQGDRAAAARHPELRNLCIVVCEQVLSFVLDIADRILVMEDGRIVHTDTREHVDEAAIARFLAV